MATEKKEVSTIEINEENIKKALDVLGIPLGEMEIKKEEPVIIEKAIESEVNKEEKTEIPLDLKPIVKAEIAEALETQNKELIEKFDAIGIISKAILESNNELKDLNKGLEKRIKALEDKPEPRKSITKAIEKDFGNKEIEKADENTLSLSRDKKKVQGILMTKSGIEKGEFNQLYSDAVIQYEGSHTLPEAVIRDLTINDKYKIVQ